MEIAPIPGVRVAPVVKTPPSERDVAAVFDITSIAHAGDDSYTGSGQQSAGGQDDEPEEQAPPAEFAHKHAETESAADREVSVNFFV